MSAFALLSSSLAAEGPKDAPAGASKGKEKWISLFDGKSVGKWKPVDKFDFKRHGKVYVKKSAIILEEGSPGTAIRWSGKFPKKDYELAFECQRVKGSDFFCAMTFPVGDTGLTLILGGWGGWVIGLSNIDGYRAVDNETCQAAEFKNDVWYRVRMKVTEPKIDVWLDEKHIIELKTEKRKLEVDWVMEPCQPLGVSTWYTTGALRKIRYRPIEAGAAVED
jgi:hypothetical protein